VSCAGGETGVVTEGLSDIEVTEASLQDLPRTRTEVMLNLADPSAAFRWWRLPVRGVGLARMEFVITSAVRVHPMALLHPERVTDAAARAEIGRLIRGHESGEAYFIDQLARGLSRIAAMCHPRPVIVRMSDFKTNEYADLLGGQAFEPREENPMIGFRGASRYYSEEYRAGFALECRAIDRLRRKIGLRNVIVMIPFCRTPEEADRVLAEMAAHGLKRGEDGLEVYVMCEIPSNVIRATEFAGRFDGFSIGSNDLTQLTLGVDRDSEALSDLFREDDPAVLWMIEEVIAKAHAAGAKVGFCGQAPSNDPAYAERLVGYGIDSISVTPDSFLKVLRRVARAEAACARRA
jgi:pyruvate,water dikinase